VKSQTITHRGVCRTARRNYRVLVQAQQMLDDREPGGVSKCSEQLIHPMKTLASVSTMERDGKEIFAHCETATVEIADAKIVRTMLYSERFVP
jgi:hypothetical protein